MLGVDVRMDGASYYEIRAGKSKSFPAVVTLVNFAPCTIYICDRISSFL